MFCRKCGKELLSDSSFCDKCGTEVAATAGEDATSSAGEMPDPDDRQKWDEWYTGVAGEMPDPDDEQKWNEWHTGVVETVGAREVLPSECPRCGHPCGENGTTCPNCGDVITAEIVATPEQHRLIDEFLDRNIENLRAVAPPPAPKPAPKPVTPTPAPEPAAPEAEPELEPAAPTADKGKSSFFFAVLAGVVITLYLMLGSNGRMETGDYIVSFIIWTGMLWGVITIVRTMFGRDRPVTNRENREVEKNLRHAGVLPKTGWQKYWGFMGWWAGTFWILLGIGAVLVLLPVIAGLFS